MALGKPANWENSPRVSGGRILNLVAAVLVSTSRALAFAGINELLLLKAAHKGGGSWRGGVGGG